MAFQVGDLGADHASDHAAVGALLADYIVTDLVLFSLALPLLAHVGHILSPVGSLLAGDIVTDLVLNCLTHLLLAAELLYHRGALMLQFCVVTRREIGHHFYPHLAAIKSGTVLRQILQIQHIVVASDENVI